MTSRVGPYRVQRLLKRGGQGSVYLGYDARLKRQVAVKIYQLPRQRREQKLLLDRARLVGSIQGPRVVQVYDVIVSTEHLALIMEYVPGTDLEEVLRYRQPSIDVIVSVASSTAGAIACARQRKIVHGDIKAANLLLSMSGELKLTDFGIALPSGTSALAQGSPSCLAPEQIRGEKVDVRTDLFGLGCLLYRMLTGVHPFADERGLDLDRLLHEEPRPVANLWDEREPLPPGLVELVDGLLQKNPESRPPNTHQVRQKLRDIRNYKPTPVGNPLLEYAGPWLQPPSEDDIPPQLPGSLRRSARSELRDSMSGVLARRWRYGSVGQRSAIAGLGLALVVSLSAVSSWFIGGEESVLLEPPLVQVQGGSGPGLSTQLLLSTLEEELRNRLGPDNLQVSEDIRPRAALFREGRQPQTTHPRQRLRMGVICRQEGCLLELRNRVSGDEYLAQALLPAAAGVDAWRAELSSLVDIVLRSKDAPLRRATLLATDLVETGS